MSETAQSRSNKFALTLLIIAAIFWLGAINIRALIGNELLIYDQFRFRTAIPPDRENTLFQMIANSSIVIISSYTVVLICVIWFLKTTTLKLRENGWLLMSTIIFFMFLPVEVYTYYLDLKFILLYYSHPPNHDELLRIFGNRLGALSGVPIIALLCYYTIIVLAVFKPLRRPAAPDAEEKKDS
jgi:hypothetical protein